MKMNWGWRIVVLYGGFVTLMLFLVYKTTTVKDDLVAKDYYAKELKFQEQLDKQNRANQLKEPLTWNVHGRKVELQFPAELMSKPVKAEILFYKTNDEKKDFVLSCSPDKEGVCQLSSAKFNRGVYQMQIDWSAGGVTYYNEGTINIQ
jgi:hypothetical protein